MVQTVNIRSVEEARALVEDHPQDHVRVGVFDIDGILRGKYLHRDKFLAALDHGFGFCDVVLGWDSQDQLYDSARYTGWHTAYPDAPVRILPTSARRLPFESHTPFFLGEFAGAAEAVCPRGLLRRVLQRAEKLGYTARAACEFEYFLFDETPHSVREKHYRDLKTITPGFFGYSTLRSAVHAEYYHELLDTCAQMRMPIEGLHTETGAGVVEAALQVSEALEAADRAALFKTFTKVLAQRRGWMASFMAKWSNDWPGQSGHIHLSLQDMNGQAVFHDPQAEHHMSDVMRWFIGGQQRHMPDLLAMVACTVNSYSRLVPGFWAPTAATWGVDNRTTALRVIPGSAGSQRMEYRVAGADINPYIAMAAALGSGLLGIEQKIEPTPQVIGNAYAQEFPSELQLPGSLSAAAARLRDSAAAHDLFGSEFVDHYVVTREWEEREFRKNVTSWELERYFEII